MLFPIWLICLGPLFLVCLKPVLLGSWVSLPILTAFLLIL